MDGRIMLGDEGRGKLVTRNRPAFGKKTFDRSMSESMPRHPPFFAGTIPLFVCVPDVLARVPTHAVDREVAEDHFGEKPVLRDLD
jgi:hypothetical protein